MFHPFLFVGVGGSGGDTLRHLHRELKTRLDQVGVPMPSGWQFVHIDTRATREHRDKLPLDDGITYIGLAPRGVNYSMVVQSIRTRWPETEPHMTGWRPDRTRVAIPIEEGAGQYRAIGRAVGLQKLDHIGGVLRASARALEQGVALEGLRQVTKRLTGSAEGDPETPTAVVFSSLAGGTGSGIFLDVCDLLRGIDGTWTDNPVTILYAPDVFDHLKPGERKGVHANALHAVSELLAGYWIGNENPDPLHLAAGIDVAKQRRSGPEHSFIVGTGNDQLQLSTQDDVFAVVGRTVASWATSLTVQQRFKSYVTGNWQNNARMSDPLGLSAGPVELPFSALGHASLSLGRDVFAQYGSQCLSRAVADRLLAGSEVAANTNADDTGRLRWPAYVKAVLDVQDHQNLAHALFAALHPTREAVVDAAVTVIREKLSGKDRTLSAWRKVIPVTVTEFNSDHETDQEKLLIERFRVWAKAASPRLLETTSEYVAAYGLVVTEKLIRWLHDQLSGEIVGTVAAMGRKDEEIAATYAEEIHRALGEEPRRRIRRRPEEHPVDSVAVRQALENGAEALLGRGFDAVVRRRIAALLADFCSSVVKPLLDTLSSGLHTLRTQASLTQDGRASKIHSWPEGPEFPVPVSMRPGRTQFLVDGVDDFPAVLSELLIGASRGVTNAGDALDAAVTGILRTGWRQEAGVPELIAETTSWEPVMATDWEQRPVRERAATFSGAFDADLLVKHTTAWMNQNHSFEPYLQQTLANALGGEHPTDREGARINRFLGLFRAAVDASAPLVRLDRTYKLNNLTRGVGFERVISEIPLNKESKAGAETFALLTGLVGMSVDLAEKHFNPLARNEIEFTSFLSQPCHPMAFHSLTEPIRRNWTEQRADVDGRSAFNQWRRSRSLARSVPLYPEARVRLTRGWFLAMSEGGFDLVGGGRELLVTLADGTHLIFSLMGAPPLPGDVFDGVAAIIESLPLLLVENPDKEGEATRSYQDLQRLNDLRREDLAAPGNEGRLRALLSWYNRATMAFPPSPAEGTSRAWELREDIKTALRSLLDEAGSDE
ncbi:tubulin-like doman-containing protein [Amycolatopsis sp. RTGN1]|uniref:tubulin-like doman-containing protein n=1 Tax=Amycolatopsis ponsaeliensis TaxID=2992142 RepID=UPI00254C736D|nr:tubulin-like doman-containing protein [Amycolatopsis sp. RTGN1]